jgi:hypothetical protein
VSTTSEERDAYINRRIEWMLRGMPQEDRDFIMHPQQGCLSGVYNGTSKKIRHLIELAYFRGVRKGLGTAWEADQPIVLR